jgi:hypothetical protein
MDINARSWHQSRDHAPSFTPYSTPAITAIQELAAAHGLFIWDPQSDDAYLPDRAED